MQSWARIGERKYYFVFSRTFVVLHALAQARVVEVCVATTGRIKAHMKTYPDLAFVDKRK